MKVDAYHNIQIDTVHLGLTPVEREDVLKAYNGYYIPSSMLKHQPNSSVSICIVCIYICVYTIKIQARL